MTQPLATGSLPGTAMATAQEADDSILGKWQLDDDDQVAGVVPVGEQADPSASSGAATPPATPVQRWLIRPKPRPTLADQRGDGATGEQPNTPQDSSAMRLLPLESDAAASSPSAVAAGAPQPLGILRPPRTPGTGSNVRFGMRLYNDGEQSNVTLDDDSTVASSFSGSVASLSLSNDLTYSGGTGTAQGVEDESMLLVARSLGAWTTDLVATATITPKRPPRESLDVNAAAQAGLSAGQEPEQESHGGAGDASTSASLSSSSFASSAEASPTLRISGAGLAPALPATSPSRASDSTDLARQSRSPPVGAASPLHAPTDDTGVAVGTDVKTRLAKSSVESGVSASGSLDDMSFSDSFLRREMANAVRGLENEQSRLRDDVHGTSPPRNVAAVNGSDDARCVPGDASSTANSDGPAFALIGHQRRSAVVVPTAFERAPDQDLSQSRNTFRSARSSASFSTAGTSVSSPAPSLAVTASAGTQSPSSSPRPPVHMASSIHDDPSPAQATDRTARSPPTSNLGLGSRGGNVVGARPSPAPRATSPAQIAKAPSPLGKDIEQRDAMQSDNSSLVSAAKWRPGSTSSASSSASLADAEAMKGTSSPLVDKLSRLVKNRWSQTRTDSSPAASSASAAAAKASVGHGAHAAGATPPSKATSPCRHPTASSESASARSSPNERNSAVAHFGTNMPGVDPVEEHEFEALTSLLALLQRLDSSAAVHTALLRERAQRAEAQLARLVSRLEELAPELARCADRVRELERDAECGRHEARAREEAVRELVERLEAQLGRRRAAEQAWSRRVEDLEAALEAERARADDRSQERGADLDDAPGVVQADEVAVATARARSEAREEANREFEARTYLLQRDHDQALEEMHARWRHAEDQLSELRRRREEEEDEERESSSEARRREEDLEQALEEATRAADTERARADGLERDLLQERSDHADAIAAADGLQARDESSHDAADQMAQLQERLRDAEVEKVELHTRLEEADQASQHASETHEAQRTLWAKRERAMQAEMEKLQEALHCAERADQAETRGTELLAGEDAEAAHARLHALEEARRELETERERVKALEARVAGDRSSLSDSEREDWQQQAERAGEELDGLRALYEQAKAVEEQLRSQLTERDRSLLELRRHLDDAEASGAEDRRARAQLEHRLDELQARYDTLLDSIADMEGELKRASDQKSALEARMQSMAEKAGIAALPSPYTQEDSNLRRGLEDAVRDAADARQELEASRRRIAALEREMGDRGLQIARLEKLSRRLEEETESYSIALSSKQQELALLKRAASRPASALAAQKHGEPRAPTTAVVQRRAGRPTTLMETLGRRSILALSPQPSAPGDESEADSTPQLQKGPAQVHMHRRRTMDPTAVGVARSTTNRIASNGAAAAMPPPAAPPRSKPASQPAELSDVCARSTSPTVPPPASLTDSTMAAALKTAAATDVARRARRDSTASTASAVSATSSVSTAGRLRDRASAAGSRLTAPTRASAARSVASAPMYQKADEPLQLADLSSSRVDAAARVKARASSSGTLGHLGRNATRPGTATAADPPRPVIRRRISVTSAGAGPHAPARRVSVTRRVDGTVDVGAADNKENVGKPRGRREDAAAAAGAASDAEVKERTDKLRSLPSAPRTSAVRMRSILGAATETQDGVGADVALGKRAVPG